MFADRGHDLLHVGAHASSQRFADETPLMWAEVMPDIAYPDAAEADLTRVLELSPRESGVLVQRGLASTRSQAQRLIASGMTRVRTEYTATKMAEKFEAVLMNSRLA